MLVSVRFIGSLDFKIKTKNQTKLDRFRLIQFSLKRNHTRLDTFSILFGFRLSVSSVLSEPLILLFIEFHST